MSKVLEAKLLLQGVDLVIAASEQDVVDVVDDPLKVATAILGHAVLNGEEVAPVVVGRLDGTAAGVIGPEGSGSEFCDGCSQDARVGSAGVYPGLRVVSFVGLLDKVLILILTA